MTSPVFLANVKRKRQVEHGKISLKSFSKQSLARLTSKFYFHFIVLDDGKGKLKSHWNSSEYNASPWDLAKVKYCYVTNIHAWFKYSMTREMETFWLYHEGHTPARSLWKSYRYISKCHDIFCSQHLIMTALQPLQTRIFNSGKMQNTSEWNVQLPLKRIKEITLTRIYFHFSLNTWFQHHHLTKQIWLNMFQVTTEVDFILLIHQPKWSLLLRQTPF